MNKKHRFFQNTDPSKFTNTSKISLLVLLSSNIFLIRVIKLLTLPNKYFNILKIIALTLILTLITATANNPENTNNNKNNQNPESSSNLLITNSKINDKDLKGSIKIDGSSTVYPISEAVAEEFQRQYRKIRVTISVSGTGGGFKKFLAGEIDINNASRKIKPSEIAKAQAKQLEFIEIPVAYDGISVVVNKKNTWVNTLTTEQLKQIWSPHSKIFKWSDIDPKWPDKTIKLYAPGADSGTFDYFTERINGKSRVSRSDYTASEDDSVLIKGVAGDPDSLGYFGFAYYEEYKSKIKSIAIIDKKTSNTAIHPSHQTIADGSYYLSRPIFIYASLESAKKNHLQAFLHYYLSNASSLVESVGYVSMTESAYKRAIDKVIKSINDKTNKQPITLTDNKPSQLTEEKISTPTTKTSKQK